MTQHLFPIAFLAHSTRWENLEGIVREGYLYTTYEREAKKLRASGLNKAAHANAAIVPYRMDLSEFPGIFMQWYTGVEGEDEMFMPNGRVTFVFGGDLLQLQHNYHLNLMDRNGFFTETLTLFPEEVQHTLTLQHIQRVRAFWTQRHGISAFQAAMNEVVFHDKVAIALARWIWFTNKEDVAKAKALLPAEMARKCRLMPTGEEKIYTRLPITTPRNALRYVDRTSRACRVFSSDHRYTGIKIPLYLPHLKHPRYASSLSYVKAIAQRAGLSKATLNKLSTVQEVEKHMEELDVYTRHWLTRVRES